MGKRKEVSREEGREEGTSRQERRSKQRHEVGSTPQPVVNLNLNRLFKDTSRIQLFNEKFFKREILEYKHVNFGNLVKLYEDQRVDVGNYIASHNWSEFVQVHRPINRTLIRILISNLDESTMQSCIGKVKVDLSMESWCKVFELELISNEEEAAVMDLSKEDVFFRLTGISNLGMEPFIKINQLHQEANVRLAAQVVMNVLVPKKGSKEQIKLAEGRLLYAMVYGKKINLVRMIVERLKSAMGRKTSPICYGMHLMAIMAKAGVDLYCAGVDVNHFDSVIDHHTLRRLGYKYQHGGWDYVGKRKGQSQVPVAEEAEEEEGDEHIEAEAAQVPHPHAPSSPRTRPFPPSSQTTDFATKDDLTHLQQFLFEQLQLFQATILSTLDKMDSRLKNLEDHLILQPQPSPHHYSPFPDPTDPKGKRPIPSSPLSIHSSPKSSHHTSHKSKSSSSSTSSQAATTRFKISARKIPTTSSPHPSPSSSDSEATQSDSPPQSPPEVTTQPASPPPAPPIPTTAPSPSQTTATYTRRRKLAVTRPTPLGHPYLLMPPPPSSPPPPS